MLQLKVNCSRCLSLVSDEEYCPKCGLFFGGEEEMPLVPEGNKLSWYVWLDDKLHKLKLTRFWPGNRFCDWVERRLTVTQDE